MSIPVTDGKNLQAFNHGLFRASAIRLLSGSNVFHASSPNDGSRSRSVHNASGNLLPMWS